MKQLGLMILGIFCIFLLNGCSDFLEEKSQDEVIPKTVEDYNELLLNYMGYTDIWSVLYVLSDETGIGEKLLRSDTDKDDYRAVEIKGVFTWQPDMWETESVGVNSAYEDTYKLIMGVNAVLDGIDEATGDQKTRDRIKAEALGMRGFYYFFLVNLYGEPYNYNKDALGVPLKLTAALEENGIARATVGEIYEQIVNDLEASSKLFSNLPKQRGDYRINGTTVDILLSRVYLFMERYDETIAAADKAIQSAEGLTDYTALPGDTEFFMPTYDHSEVEWVYGAVSLESGMHVFAPARELMTYFEGKEDRREIFWFENNTKDEVQINKIAYSYQSVPNNTIRVSEAYLNRAEAYVLSGQANKNTLALADLNELRRHRIVGYEDVTIADETELLAEIREERYVELCYEGHRWFDLRRYGMPSISHDYKARSSLPWVTYTLREKDPLYTLPFPTTVFKNNIQLKQTLLPGSRKERVKLNRTKMQKMMGKYVVYLSMLGLLVCLACSEDKKIGEVETLTLDYELPQGKSPADDRIVEIYEKYGSYILYEYTDKDFYYDSDINFGRTYVYQLLDPQCVENMVDLLDEIWFDLYPEKFHQQTLPYHVFLASDLFYEDLFGEIVREPICTGAFSAVVSVSTEMLQELTSEMKLELKNSLQIKLWKFWQSYNYIELPDEFYEVSNYVGVANTDESSPNYARARGFVDGYNQTTLWYTSIDDWNAGTVSQKSDLYTFIECMLTRSSEEWEDDLAWPLVKKKYDILRNWIQKQYGFDIQVVGNLFCE